LDASLDGSAPDAIADVTLPDGFNPLDCNGGTLTFGGPCTTQTEQLCESWTQDRAFGAYGHGHCQNIGGGSVCTMGDYCPNANQECQCSAIVVCAPGQVCYSDTPDGSTHCKQACTTSP